MADKKQSRICLWNVVVQDTWYKKKLFQSEKYRKRKNNRQNLGNVQAH